MAWVNVIDLFHPVDTVYYNSEEINPGTIFGGTWTFLGTTTVGSTTVYAWKRTA